MLKLEIAFHVYKFKWDYICRNISELLTQIENTEGTTFEKAKITLNNFSNKKMNALSLPHF